MMKPAEIAIFCDDVEATVGFYAALLGREPVHRGAGIAVFDVDGLQVLIHERCEAEPGGVPCENHVAFAVDDVDAAIADLTRRGLAVEHAPRDYDWGRSAYLRDPAGGLIELKQTPGG